MNLEKYVHPTVVPLLIGNYDVGGFAAYGRKHDPVEIFRLAQGLADLAGEIIKDTGGRIVKYIGDSGFFVYPEELADSGVNACFELRRRGEAYLRDFGLGRLAVFLHFGEVVAGMFGAECFGKSPDVFGNEVNTMFLLHFEHPKPTLVITPQVFRKLKPETRKSFHKFTPPIVYTA